MPSLVEIGPVVLEKKMKIWIVFDNNDYDDNDDNNNFVNISSLFRYYLLFEKGGSLHLNNLVSPLPKDALCQVRLKWAKWFWRRFLNFVNMFSLFHLNSLYPRMLCAMYCWNWPSGSGEEEENVKSWRQQRLWRQRRQRRRTTDKFWSEKIWLRWAKNWRMGMENDNPLEDANNK